MKESSFGWLSRPWLIVALSVLALGIPALLLWSPWDRQGITGGMTLRLYCAAGLTRPVEEIIERYSKEHGVRVEPTYDGAGKLLSTIRVVGGGDLFLCSDSVALEEARKEKLVAEVIPLAVLRPVLVVNQRTQERLKEKGKPVTGIQDLLRDDLKVVLANPKLASIGKITQRALPQEMWQALETKHTTLATVTEVAQAVRVNENDDYIGVVWSATAAQVGGLEVIAPPAFRNLTDHAVIAVLKNTKQPTAALQFARFLAARDRGLVIVKQYHFEPVAEADVWQVVPVIRVDAGAMLNPAVDETILAFAKREGVTINTAYAGCGLLVSKMKTEGTYPDAYFSCDQTFLDMVQPGFEPGVKVARNDIVLITPKGNPSGIKALDDLKKDVRVGVAHPVNSALGKLTDDLFKKFPGLHEGIYRKDRKHPVVHSDAAHDLVNKMRAGALDAAVVYVSNVQSAAETTRVQLEMIDLKIPEAQAVQPFAISKDTKHPQLLRRLQQALTTDEQAAHFRKLGFHWLLEQ